MQSHLNQNNKLRWLASDINFKLLHTGCSIAHANSNETVIAANTCGFQFN